MIKLLQINVTANWQGQQGALQKLLIRKQTKKENRNEIRIFVYA